MDSRIANKDKTILSLQLEELEPVFMGEKKKQKTNNLVWQQICMTYLLIAL